MGLSPSFIVVEDTASVLCIKDIGPWDKHFTVTNGAEAVVATLVKRLGHRRLEYYDSSGDRSQLLVENGVFAGFTPCGKDTTNEKDVHLQS